MNILELDPTVKRNGFRDFLLQRNPSESFAAKYMTYLTSSLVRAKTKQVSGQDNTEGESPAHKKENPKSSLFCGPGRA